MRIGVTFFSEKPIVLPWNYLDWLQGIFYRTMERGMPQLAHRVHDEGFVGSGKRYKLVTFSLLYPERYRVVSGGLRVEGGLHWWVSSPLGSVIEAVALGLLGEPEVWLGQHRVQVGEVRVMPIPQFTGPVTLVTLSPIFVTTGERTRAGRFQKRFLSPGEPDFVRVLNENARRKAEAVWGRVPEGELRFEWLSRPESKLITVNRFRVRGWMMRFRVSGPEELIKIGYEAGFGERNAQGFGMVRVESTGKTNKPIECCGRMRIIGPGKSE